MKVLHIIIVSFCFSCSADITEKSETPLKSDMVNQQGKADSSVDYCEKFGWYGDGECDTFCLQEDVQDCGSQVEQECSALCQNRLDTVCFTNEQCEETCQTELRNWSDAQAGYFSTCLDQPLCYQTAEQCVNNASKSNYCEQACSEQEENQFGWCGATECVEYCWNNIDDWDNSTEQAFLLCANENPLCYQTMENCIETRK